MSGTIPATISHQFELSDIENAGVDQSLYSPEVEVVHNDVALKFNLKLTPNDPAEENKDHMGLYLMYQDGPQAKIKLGYHFLVINGRRRNGLTDSKEREFELRNGRGKARMLPRSVKALRDGGHLTLRGKILRISAELSIPDSAFVRPLQIFTSISQKFDLERILNARPGEGVRVHGSVVSVSHNNVRLDFKLFALPNDTNQNGDKCIGFYVGYIKGLNSDLVMEVELIVVKGRKRHSMMLSHGRKFEMGKGVGSGVLPRSIEALTAGGYLGWDNKLHVIAELAIPQSAFAAPEQVPAYVHVDLLGFHLYHQLTSPANTSSPVSNRIELVSKDDTHLWAHKDVLSCASNIFNGLFDPDKPEEAKMHCLKQGVLTFDDLSGEALKQMLHFIYMRQPGKEFEKFALEIVPVADRFLFKGLKEVCEQCLVERMDLMLSRYFQSMDSLCRCLADGYEFSLPALTAACAETLPMIIQHSTDIDQKHLESLIDLSQQHHLAPLKSACEAKLAHIMDNSQDQAQFLSLLSLARKHQLDLLVTHCVRWFRNKIAVLKADGFVRFLMNDDGENGQDVLEFLLEGMATLPLP